MIRKSIIKPQCCCCGYDIENGDTYYDINGDVYCDICINEFINDNKYILDIAGELADMAYDAELDRKLRNEEYYDEQ